VLVIVAIALVACGGDEKDGAAIPSPTGLPSPSPTQPLIAGAPRVAVEAAVNACREKDADTLGDLVLGGADEAEIQALFARGTDVRLGLLTLPDQEQDVVEVDVALTIQRTTGAEEVERTWELQRTADGWLFTSLPDCY